jgi:SAM-dependent methyltransferase
MLRTRREAALPGVLHGRIGGLRDGQRQALELARRTGGTGPPISWRPWAVARSIIAVSFSRPARPRHRCIAYTVWHTERVTARVSADERYRREREFHDGAFGSGVRRRQAKYYPVDAPSRLAYHRALSTFEQGDRVLEYGCGLGSAAYDLAARGVDVVGIDISPVAVQQATSRAHELGLDITFTEMNAEHLQLDPGSFDGVCGSGILHHLQLEVAFQEVARVLTPAGSAVFLEPLGHNPVIRAYRRLTPRVRSEDEHPLLVSDIDAARRWFDGVEVSYHQLAWLLSVPFARSRAGPALAGRLGAIDDRMFRSTPFIRRYAWTVVVQLHDARPGRTTEHRLG